MAKAEEDIQSRSENPGELVPAETTYVAVTLRLWPGRVKDGSRQDGSQHKAEWAKEHRDQYGWKDLQVLDAEDLHAWLLKCPAAALWLAQSMGRKVAGARSLTHHWSKLEALRSGISRDIFLAGREGFVTKLAEWINDEPGIFEARTWATEDLLDAVAAWWTGRTGRHTAASRCQYRHSVGCANARGSRDAAVGGSGT